MNGLESLKGKFIVFDGNEGCGKSTQTLLARGRLERAGVSTLLVRDPGTTEIGEKIRQLLLDPGNNAMAMRCEMLLYMAARAQMMKQVIMPALQEGKLVLGDRFISSTLAYQLGGDGLTANEIRGVGDIAINGRWPDLTILLDLPVSMSSKRIRPKFIATTPGGSEIVAKDRIEQRPPAYHEQVRKNYLAQAHADPDHFRIVDASRSQEDVHETIWQILSMAEFLE